MIFIKRVYGVRGVFSFDLCLMRRIEVEMLGRKIEVFVCLYELGVFRVFAE